MAYHYGDTRTANNGIWIWLQGWRNRMSHEYVEDVNYIPKHLDINQKSNWVRDTVIAFLKTKGIDVTKKKYNHRKHPAIVQKHFKEYTEFIKSNYQPN